MVSPDSSRLRRALNPMPPDIAASLEQRNLRAAYDARPAYQRNDYLGWIGRARQAATRDKRIAQMLHELADGRLYMNMSWRSADR